MTLIYLWIYTLILVFLWVMFVFAKLHAYKFKAFSTHIEKVTKFMVIYLITLSIIWYILILFSSWNHLNNLNDYKKDQFNFNEVNY